MNKEATAADGGKKKGVRLRTLNIVMIVLACALAVFLLFSVSRTSDGYGTMKDATEEYIACQTYASELQAGSDYLTEEVRLFVVTGEPEHVDEYFYEVNVRRRRESALDGISHTLAGTETYARLSEALRWSEELLERECYAMRLTIEANDYALAGFPEELRGVVLSEEDLILSPAEQQALAVRMVFDDAYQSYRNKISENVSLCMNTLVNETRSRQLDSSAQLLGLLRQQNILIAIMLVIVFAVVLFTSLLVIHPLRRNVAFIRNQERLPMTGSYELQFMAETYNRMFEQNRRQNEELSHEATHDALTGLYNRSVFEKLRETCEEGSVALLIVDVDKFKEVNDGYGHEVGDRVLKRVAALLQGAFRSEDYVCRIGGDEFAVIMVHAGSALRELVRGKYENVSRALREPAEGLPPVTLSVGVAFGDRPEPGGDIFNDADAALYRVKENGRGAIAFF